MASARKTANEPGCWRVDFHTHTASSPDSLTTPQALVRAAQARLHRVVVTDHNSIRGALQARELAPDLVIVGEEIMTSAGELLAIFVQEEVPAGLSPLETIERLRDQGAFISVSHPFDRWRKGHWSPDWLARILPLVDAIEGFNARTMWPGSNRAALTWAARHGVAWTAGSDAHAAFEVGRAGLCLPPFANAQELRLALPQAQPFGRRSGYWVHLVSRYAHRRQRKNRS